MTGKKPDAGIKAGFIYSIMPQTVKSFLLTRMSRGEMRAINEGMKRIDVLTFPEKRGILSEFSGSMEAFNRRRKDALDNALLLCIFIASLLVVVSFVYAKFTCRSADRTIDFIEAMLSNGGMHLIAFPFIWGMAVSEYYARPAQVLFASKSPAGDIVAAVTAGLITTALFIPESAGGRIPAPVPLGVFYCIVSVTAGPAAEELFFRYMMFLKPGEKYGYLLSGAVSSILFAAIHMPDSWSLLVRYTLAGCVLCGVCNYRKNIFTPLLAHVCANGLLLFI